MSAPTIGIIAVAITFCILVVVLLLTPDANDTAYDNDEWRDRNG